MRPGSEPGVAEVGTGPITGAEFAALMAPLGPFEPAPSLAAAVSGGADSLALAVCARDWVRARGGTLVALVADHGLRPELGGETSLTLSRLAHLGIPAQAQRLAIAPGPALAARAREARLAALTAACAERGILHLLLGHHAGDQAETVLMRVLGRSAPAGLSGMATVRETGPVRLLRPLLSVPPARLRATLLTAKVGWVEDPSNADQRALRSRIRAWRNDPGGVGRATAALSDAAAGAGRERAIAEGDAAAALAASAVLRPEGFAVLRPGPVDPAVLSALLQMVGGRAYPPSTRQVAALARSPGPATLAGVRLSPAGRFGPGLLLTREVASMAAPAPAANGVWDGRFRLVADAALLEGQCVGALGAAVLSLRSRSALPAIVLETLPALWRKTALVAVPHLDHPGDGPYAGVEALFCPPRAAAPAPFCPARIPLGVQGAASLPMLSYTRYG